MNFRFSPNEPDSPFEEDSLFEDEFWSDETCPLDVRPGESKCCSWHLEVLGHHVGLVASHGRHEPDLVAFYLKAETLDDFPCGHCSVVDPAIPIEESLESGRFMQLYLGIWSFGLVRQWCHNLIDLTGKPGRVISSFRSDGLGLVATREKEEIDFRLMLIGRSINDLPCQVCECSKPPLEKVKHADWDEAYQMPLGQFSAEMLEDFSTSLLSLIEKK